MEHSAPTDPALIDGATAELLEQTDVVVTPPKKEAVGRFQRAVHVAGVMILAGFAAADKPVEVQAADRGKKPVPVAANNKTTKTAAPDAAKAEEEFKKAWEKEFIKKGKKGWEAEKDPVIDETRSSFEAEALWFASADSKKFARVFPSDESKSDWGPRGKTSVESNTTIYIYTVRRKDEGGKALPASDKDIWYAVGFNPLLSQTHHKENPHGITMSVAIGKDANTSVERIEDMIKKINGKFASK